MIHRHTEPKLMLMTRRFQAFTEKEKDIKKGENVYRLKYLVIDEKINYQG